MVIFENKKPEFINKNYVMENIRESTGVAEK